MRLLVLVFTAVLLSGCAAALAKHSRTILMNSEGERQECTVDMLRTQASYQRYDQCIKSFEEKGYKIWGQY